MPVFDSYYIRRELIYTNIIFVIASIFWFVVGSTRLHYRSYIVSNIGGYVTMIGCIAFCGMAVLYPRYKCGYPVTRGTENNAGDDHEQNQRHLPENTKLPDTWSKFVEMHSSNFISFMQFLVKELAVENLAFIMEVVQIKHQFIASNGNTTGDDHGYLLNLPKDVPQSSLLEIQGDLDKQWVLIHNKYIVEHAGLVVNISGEIRSKCKENMVKISEMNNNDKLKMYDDCLAQLHELLTFSYFRYMRRTHKNPGTLENLVLMQNLDV